MRIIESFRRSYATYEGALKAAEVHTGGIPEHSNTTVTIAATPEGRFAPVFHVRPEAVGPSLALAQSGFHVIG